MNEPTSPAVGTEPHEWGFLQCFGERTPGEEIQEADIITAVEFDERGQHLATGDKGGRVVLFEQVEAAKRTPGLDERASPPRGGGRAVPFEYRYLTEFQSHEPEFDYLKSLEIEEKINRVKWVRQATGSRLVLSTNDKTIKLYRVYQKQVTRVTEFNCQAKGGDWLIPVGNTGAEHSPARRRSSLLPAEKLKGPGSSRALHMPKVSLVETVPAARCRRVFANAHTYHINSLSLCSDQETFITGDDLRVNLWHLDRPDIAFNCVDIKPANMEELAEVITGAEFAPQDCHLFCYSTSKGALRLADLRQRALADHPARVFDEGEAGQPKTFFSEIIASISSLAFGMDGRTLLARDYMTLKLWDLRGGPGPVGVFPVHEHLRSRLCDLYESDNIFDKFECCTSGNGQHFVSGSYSNQLKVVSPWGPAGARGSPAAAVPVSVPQGAAHEQVLEATRDPLRKRQPLAASKAGRSFSMLRGGAGQKKGSAGEQQAGADASQDFTSKILHLSWHPEDNVIAVAASNSLYLYASP